MGNQLQAIVKTGFRTLEVRDFTRDEFAAKLLFVIGTLTPIDGAGAKDAAPDVSRIWLTLIDLRTGRVVARHINRATMAEPPHGAERRGLIERDLAYVRATPHGLDLLSDRQTIFLAKTPPRGARS